MPNCPEVLGPHINPETIFRPYLDKLFPAPKLSEHNILIKYR